jgi:hypothetical protein
VRACQGARELGEDRDVGVEANTLDPPHTQRRERPFVLEPAELPLDRPASLVEPAPPQRLARDQRVQVVGSSVSASEAGAGEASRRKNTLSRADRKVLNFAPGGGWVGDVG